MLTKEQIKKEIEEMNEWIPISKIEERLGMPPTTLQKVLKDKRELPKKWHKILEGYFIGEKKAEKTVEQVLETSEFEEIKDAVIDDLINTNGTFVREVTAADRIKAMMQEQRKKLQNNQK